MIDIPKSSVLCGWEEGQRYWKRDVNQIQFEFPP